VAAGIPWRREMLAAQFSKIASGAIPILADSAWNSIATRLAESAIHSSS
jgi:hypothetical protein